VDILRKLYKLICSIEVILCYFGLIGGTILVIIQIVNRYFIHYEAVWIGDLSQYVFIIFIIVALSFTARQGGHTSVNVLIDNLFKGRQRIGVSIFIHFICLGLITWLTKLVYIFAKRAWHYPEYGTLVRWFNTSWLQILLFIVISFCLVHTAVNTSKQIKAYKNYK